jgi:hypothetical protein
MNIKHHLHNDIIITREILSKDYERGSYDSFKEL